MKVAIVGCGHGELEKIYGTLGRLEYLGNFKVDLLLICGDFQAVRNRNDLMSMAVPPKYRKMCDFYKYYDGELVAPVLTLIIGGNHEASAYMDELHYGGWLAPNIYHLGTAGCVRVGDIRIAGLSGIFHANDYLKGRFEGVPYNDSTIRSTYHIRALDVARLSALRNVDIMMSHDWPSGIAQYGDEPWLRRKKPYFNEDLDSGRLGSKPTMEVLKKVKPKYFFSAHLHVQFAAVVEHDNGQETRFLALDKCMPEKNFLRVIDLDGDVGPLKYDTEWLCILKKSKKYQSNASRNHYDLPSDDDLTVTEGELNDMIEKFQSDLVVPENFEQTAPGFDPDAPDMPFHAFVNPQTTAFMEKVGISEPKVTMGLSDFLGGATAGDSTSDTCSKAERGDEETPSSEHMLLSRMSAPPEDSVECDNGEEQIVAKVLAQTTAAGRTIKRRNASAYNTE